MLRLSCLSEHDPWEIVSWLPNLNSFSTLIVAYPKYPSLRAATNVKNLQGPGGSRGRHHVFSASEGWRWSHKGWVLRVYLGFGNGGWAGEVGGHLFFWANYNDQTNRRLGIPPNGGFVGESPQNDLNSGLGIIVICPGLFLGEDVWCRLSKIGVDLVCWMVSWVWKNADEAIGGGPISPCCRWGQAKVKGTTLWGNEDPEEFPWEALDLDESLIFFIFEKKTSKRI